MTNIDSLLLKDMIKGAKLNLDINKDLINSLNVFPVPDGDTGTNMSLTLASSVKEIDALEQDDIPSIMQALSKGALKGARGNSGVILSQILKGIASVFSNHRAISSKSLAEAFKAGAVSAYDAVSIPKEGTILTIIRIIGDYAGKIANRKISVVEFLDAVLKKGEETLAKTPDMLPVLKKAGVVDAGGKGLLIILYGMYNTLAGIEMKPLDEKMPDLSDFREGKLAVDVHNLDEIEFAYCTEYFVINLLPTATMADIERLRMELNKIGDSVIVVGDLQLIKVHIHTNEPNKALEYALKLGELDKLKIENMLEQHRELVLSQEKKELKPFGMVAICAGDGIREVFIDLNADAVLEGGQTMNPSVADIVEIVDSINAETVFILPNNKNIILAAEQARELTKSKLVVIATVNVPEGIASAIAYDPNSTEDKITVDMQNAAGEVRCIQVTHSVRETNIDGFDLKVGDIIAVDKSIIAKGATSEEVVNTVFAECIDEDVSTVTLYYGEDVKEKEAKELASSLQNKYDEIDIEVCYGGQPHYFYLISIE